MPDKQTQYSTFVELAKVTITNKNENQTQAEFLFIHSTTVDNKNAYNIKLVTLCSS